MYHTLCLSGCKGTKNNITGNCFVIVLISFNLISGAWIKEENKDEIVRSSNTPSATCLYGIHPMKRNPYIEVKQGWMRYLYKEYDGLTNYFKKLYLDYLEE